METFEDYGITIPYRRKTGKLKLTCPRCSATRSNPKDRSLSVDLDKGVWKCHHCDWAGRLKTDEWRREVKPEKSYKRPEQRPLASVPPKITAYFAQRGISNSTLTEAKVDAGVEFSPEDGRDMTVIRFNYFLDGELVNVKSRTGNKHFRLISGAELTPYNIDAIRDTPQCIITEGEIDCLSFIEAGRTDVVSVPNGAKNMNFLDDFMEGWFDDKEVIYIAADTDTAGLSMRDELIRRFGAERCRIVTYGEGCKDANEHLVKYGKDSLIECLKRAKDIKVDGVFTLDDYEDSLDDLWQNGLRKGMLTGLENFDMLISFETKRLCVVTGIPSSGKSEFIDEMCVRFNILHGWKAAFFSPENMPIAYHASKLLEKLTGTKMARSHLKPTEFEMAKDYLRDNFFHILPKDANTLANILTKAEYLVKRKGIKVLVIDPYNRIESDSGNLSETQLISRQLDMMTNFAQKHDVLVILMAHPHKITKVNTDEDGIPTLYHINGSAHFYNKADFGIVVHRNKVDNYTLVRVSKVKFRHLGEGGDAKFKYDTRNGRYAPWDGVERNAPQWVTGSFLELSHSNDITPSLPPNDEFLSERSDLPF